MISFSFPQLYHFGQVLDFVVEMLAMPSAKFVLDDMY